MVASPDTPARPEPSAGALCGSCQRPFSEHGEPHSWDAEKLPSCPAPSLTGTWRPASPSAASGTTRAGVYAETHPIDCNCAPCQQVSREMDAAPAAPLAREAETPTFHRSASCDGERCTLCGAPAELKVGEEIMHDDPNPNRHNWTAYICAPCGTRLFFRRAPSSSSQRVVVRKALEFYATEANWVTTTARLTPAMVDRGSRATVALAILIDNPAAPTPTADHQE